MAEHPREAHPLVTWWLEPDFYANVPKQAHRWDTSKLAEMMVPTGSVPLLDLRVDKRGVIVTAWR